MWRVHSSCSMRTTFSGYAEYKGQEALACRSAAFSRNLTTPRWLLNPAARNCRHLRRSAATLSASLTQLQELGYVAAPRRADIGINILTNSPQLQRPGYIAARAVKYESGFPGLYCGATCRRPRHYLKRLTPAQGPGSSGHAAKSSSPI